MTHFKIGDRVILSDSGRENTTYASFVNETLIVTHRATRYMEAKEYFARGKPTGYHPGFDVACGDALYDLKTLDGKPINCSLYGWELKKV